MEIIVGIGEYVVSNKRTDIIKTFALASCVAVIAYSPSKKVAGMIHIALPFPGRSESGLGPGHYATTGVPLLIDTMCGVYGCLKGDLRISIYGGANSINAQDLFNIGRRNVKAVTSTLSSLNLVVHKAEVGGIISRTLEMDVITGSVRVNTQPIKI